jgi:glycosyltransferase involved in cell wall biosynthesis
MKILIVSPYFPPQNAVASLRVHAFARCWCDAGHEVTVLTPAKRADQQGLDLPLTGIRVVELPYVAPALVERLRSSHRPSPADDGAFIASGQAATPTAPTASGRLQRWKEHTGIFSSVRMPDLTDWWIKPAVHWCRSHQETGPWDCVVSSSGPYTAHLVALKLKRQGLASRWVADFRDLWTGNHQYRGLFPFTVRERTLESQCLRTADVITTVSEGLALSLRPRTRRPVEVIFIGFDDSDFESLPPQPVFPRDDRVRIVYTGTLYPRGQDPLPLLRAMKTLQKKVGDAANRLRLVIAGRSAELWRAGAEQCGVADMLETHGMIPRPTALGMQRDADALLLLDWTDASEGVLTSKVFEYLNAAAPILIISPHQESELIRLVNRAWRGFDAGTNEARIVDSLRALLGPQRADPMQPDREFIATLSRQRQSLRMLELIQALLPGST